MAVPRAVAAVALPADDIDYFFTADTTAREASVKDAQLDSALEAYRMATTNIPIDQDNVTATRANLDAELRRLGLADKVATAATVQSGSRLAQQQLASKGGYQNKSCYVQTKMHLVLPRLYVGSYHPASDREVLNAAGVTHICCCINVAARFPGEYQFMNLPADDTATYDMAQHFEETFAFIEKALTSGGTVLVHCGAGISRAPTITAAYIIRKLKVSHHSAVQMISSVRPCASPNLGFRKQLEVFSAQQRGLPPPKGA